ncbi:DUF3310 domain-containing protein [Exiguobacterium sp. MMG028]|uniref:DUF3310 domain-containing protein n=1 Tax=Exiguobacterium sp. MMG028 TaxID=3021979 RepID=UPI0022FF3151|nr:DUF3310 domain-containing protein [Exiguobacterium sp. MMG028]MDA5561977.1 DUF3310 domain-containing protein [Exiguobacterium sp. MMG028]
MNEPLKLIDEVGVVEGYELSGVTICDVVTDECGDLTDLLEQFKGKRVRVIVLDGSAERKTETKPTHYDTGIDTIAFLRANCPPEQVEGFLRGNAIKYLQRYTAKGAPIEDLKKSRHYIDMLIEELEGRE